METKREGDETKKIYRKRMSHGNAEEFHMKNENRSQKRRLTKWPIKWGGIEGKACAFPE
jgi:hypothetical protein